MTVASRMDAPHPAVFTCADRRLRDKFGLLAPDNQVGVK